MDKLRILARIRAEAIAKELETKNSSASPSAKERQYPKSFFITPKKDDA